MTCEVDFGLIDEESGSYWIKTRDLKYDSPSRYGQIVTVNVEYGDLVICYSSNGVGEYEEHKLNAQTTGNINEIYLGWYAEGEYWVPSFLMFQVNGPGTISLYVDDTPYGG